MPRGDGTGPMGLGLMTGRGFGSCSGANAVKFGTGFGLGLGCRRGFGRGVGRDLKANQTDSRTQKELLEEQKELLQSRLNVIDKQLENL